MTKRLMIALALAALAPMTPDARAALLVEYDLTGAAGDQPDPLATFQAAGVFGDPISRGAGLTANAGLNSINSRGWTTGTTIDPLDYYQFAVGPTGADSLDLE